MKLFVTLPFLFILLITTKVFSADNAEVIQIRTATKQACNSLSCYTIIQGAVYQSPKGSTEGLLLHNSNNVRAVITFKGRLYALQSNGKLWTWAESRHGFWIQVEENVSKVQTDDKMLFVINNEGTLGEYSGSDFSYTSIEIDGFRTGEAENFFYDMGKRNVRELAVINNEVSIVYTSNKTVPLYSSSDSKLTTIEP